jgi:hypothetical protein
MQYSLQYARGITCGVLQGIFLGLLLFITFINDLLNIKININTKLLNIADDTDILLSKPKMNNFYYETNEILNNVYV